MYNLVDKILQSPSLVLRWSSATLSLVPILCIGTYDSVALTHPLVKPKKGMNDVSCHRDMTEYTVDGVKHHSINQSFLFFKNFREIEIMQSLIA